MRKIIVFSGGVIFNKINNEFHRDNGASVISYSDNVQAWYNNGKLHRLDGPAIIRNNYQAWHINGEHYTKAEYDLAIGEMV